MLFLLFLIINADDSCDLRTAVYDSHGYLNLNSYYFDTATYTESTTSMTPQIYKDYIRKQIPCTGEWCIENQWRCDFGNNQDCYNVEHIIPKANTILEIYGCPTDIQGNLIMSYGKWNQQLSNKYYGEKALIYGSSIFKSAYKSVYKACHESEPLFYPEELCFPNNSRIYIAIVTLILIAIMISIAMFLYFRYKQVN
jgi:hypothetical protein